MGIYISLSIGFFLLNEIIMLVVTDDNITTRYLTLDLYDSLKDWIVYTFLFIAYTLLSIPLFLIIIVSWIFPKFDFRIL